MAENAIQTKHLLAFGALNSVRAIVAVKTP